MPFSWKKGKNSQKRRGDSSLLVETGLSTAIVDFAINNNGEKSKKPSKKNPAKPPKIPPRIEYNDPVSSQSSSVLPTPPFSPSTSWGSSHSGSILPTRTRDFDEFDVDDNESGVGRRVVCANGVIVAVVKIFLVVVVSLGAKEFVVGITISAFLLIFLEIVGKYACKMWKPGSDSQKESGLVVPESQRLSISKEDDSDQENKDFFDPECSDMKIVESSKPIQETQILEPNCVEGVQGKKEIKYGSSCEEMQGYQEMYSKSVAEEEVSTCDESELKREESRKNKIKSKMKKLIPKKLRSSKEGHNSESSEICSIREGTTSMSEDQGTDRSEIEGTESENEIIDRNNCKGKEDTISKKVLMEEGQPPELTRRKSRKDRIKLKMKKFVSKKLRSKKGEPNSESSEVFLIKDDITCVCEEDKTEEKKNKKS